MIKSDFFDVNNKPVLCLNKLDATYDNINKKWNSCENSKNDKCCSYYKDKEVDDLKINKINSLDEFNEKLKKNNIGIIPDYSIKSYEMLKNFNSPTFDEEKMKNLLKFSIELDENHRLLVKQYNELIFSPNEVINVDENVNKFRYLELDRKLEKYDKKTYSLYKIFFYIMLITSGVLFIRKQLKK